jgi:hypothetical protein
MSAVLSWVRRDLLFSSGFSRIAELIVLLEDRNVRRPYAEGKAIRAKSAEIALRADAAERCFMYRACLPSEKVNSTEPIVIGIFPDPLPGCTIRRIPTLFGPARNRDANEHKHIGNRVGRRTAALVIV